MKGLFFTLTLWLIVYPAAVYSADKESDLPAHLKHGELTLIFFDALCPMPHFPGCESVLDSLKENTRVYGDNTFLVFNTMYVDTDGIERFVDKHGLEAPVIIDDSMQLHDHFNVYATPYKIMLREGKVVQRGQPLQP